MCRGLWRKCARRDLCKFTIVKYTSIPLTHQTTNHEDVFRKQPGPFYGDDFNISEHWRFNSLRIHAIRDVQECLCLQETHRAPHLGRPKITGMTLVAERPYIEYGSAILIRSDLKVKGVSVLMQDNVELISIEMPGVVLHSVYKPPNEKYVLPALGYGNLPHIVMGDFNSHSTTWGYTTTDDNGEMVEQWADSCNLTLIHNAKLSKLFNSAR